MKTKPRKFIMEVCKWISEREEMKLHMDNILTSICTNLDEHQGNPKTQYPQTNTPPLQTRIAELTDKIGVGYFDFYSRITLYPYQKKKQIPRDSNLSQNKKRKYTKINLHPSPEDTSTLCRGLT